MPGVKDHFTTFRKGFNKGEIATYVERKYNFIVSL
jgi:hypothetical protein